MGSSDRKYTVISRQMETLQPLSDKLRSGELCNKVALISWNNRDIANLAQKLGCGPYNGCPMNYDASEYDDTWQISFVYNPPRSIPSDKWEIFGTVVPQGFDP